MEPTELREVIAANIRRLAAEKGLTLPMVADHAGVNTAHLYKVIKMESSPTADWLARVAAALDVKPTALLTPGS